MCACDHDSDRKSARKVLGSMELIENFTQEDFFFIVSNFVCQNLVRYQQKLLEITKTLLFCYREFNRNFEREKKSSNLE